MAKEQIELKERLLAGLAYLNAILMVLISIFYARDRRGFVMYHCVQSAFTHIAMYIAVIVIVNLSFAFSPGTYAALAMNIGPLSVISWVSYAIFAILFFAAASGTRFRIPFICSFADWLFDYVDKAEAKAEKAKKKKV